MGLADVSVLEGVDVGQKRDEGVVWVALAEVFLLGGWGGLEEEEEELLDLDVD